MLGTGSVIRLNNRPYRIIASEGTDLVMIEMDIDRYHFYRAPLQVLLDMPGIEEISDPYEPQPFMVSDEELELLGRKQEAVRAIIQGLDRIEDLASKRTCPGVRSYMETFGVSRKIAHKHIRRYLQSGMDMYSLRDGRRTRSRPENDMFSSPYRGGHAFADGSVRVPVDPELEKKYFEEGFKKIDTEKSLSYIVDVLNVKYFSTPVLDEEGNLIDIDVKPENECLSERRFRRYCKERMGAVSLAAYKKGARERVNADRIRFGTAQTGCSGPGSVIEIDACELDIIIVGSDRRQDLGRPVVYFAVDVFSTKIVGYYVGFENNSFYGATSLFDSMFFSRDRILPDAIRVDQGSEWISEGIRRLGKELGINIRIAPPAMGSYKGLVESSFHAYQKRLRAAGREYGAIYKVYESKHYDKACLLLGEVRRDIEAFVDTYNSMSRKTYELSREMIMGGVRPVPEELWKYGIENIAVPRTVTKSMEPKIVFSLCVPVKKGRDCGLSRSGFTVKGLTYICDDPLLTDLISRAHFGTGGRDTDYEVRIDPRTVGHIWVRIGKKVIRVPLGELHDAQGSFKSLTWFEYDLLYNDVKENGRTLKERDRHLRMLLAAKTDTMMKKGRKAQKAVGGSNSKKEIRAARLAAQQDERRQGVLGSAAGDGHTGMMLTAGEPGPEEDLLRGPAVPGPDLPGRGDGAAETEAFDYEDEDGWEMSYEDYF